MSTQFTYQVCAMQNNRITFVNGEWQGAIGPADVEPSEALESCPTVWDFLAKAGAAGWELVSALDMPVEGTRMQTLFLKQVL